MHHIQRHLPCWARAAIVTAALCWAGGAWAQAASEVATVNGQAISADDFAAALQQRLIGGAQDSVALREQVRQDLLVRAVLAQQAAKDKLDRDAAFKRALEAQKQALLAQFWERRWLKDHPPKDSDLRKEYERVSAEAGQHEYRVRQVVVRDETAAKLLLDQIAGGKSMADLAQAHSIEPLGKTEGGLLPWVNLTVLAEPLREAVRQASVGKVWPEPVRGLQGWHVLQVEEKRPFAMPEFDALKPQLQRAVAQNQLRQAVRSLVDDAKIVLK